MFRSLLDLDRVLLDDPEHLTHLVDLRLSIRWLEGDDLRGLRRAVDEVITAGSNQPVTCRYGERLKVGCVVAIDKRLARTEERGRPAPATASCSSPQMAPPARWNCRHAGRQGHGPTGR